VDHLDPDVGKLCDHGWSLLEEAPTPCELDPIRPVHHFRGDAGRHHHQFLREQDCKQAYVLWALYLPKGSAGSLHHSRHLRRLDAVHFPDEGWSRDLILHNQHADLQYDFSSFGPFLFAGIMGLLTTSLVQIFLPFNSTVDLAIAGFSVILFSGFILYDTQQIQKRMSPDDHIVAALNLYVDVIQLFLSVLRVVSTSSLLKDEELTLKLNNSENR